MKVKTLLRLGLASTMFVALALIIFPRAPWNAKIRKGMTISEVEQILKTAKLGGRRGKEGLFAQNWYIGESRITVSFLRSSGEAEARVLGVLTDESNESILETFRRWLRLPWW